MNNIQLDGTTHHALNPLGFAPTNTTNYDVFMRSSSWFIGIASFIPLKPNFIASKKTSRATREVGGSWNESKAKFYDQGFKLEA